MNPRPATQDDVAAMVELQRAGFVAALVPLLPSSFDVTATDAWAARLSETLASESVGSFVVDREDRDGLAGLVIYGTSRDPEPPPATAEIRALFVHPDHWRRGVGRGLVEEACTQLERWGFEAATLWSLRDNDRATAFYESAGFDRDGATQTRDELGAPEVRYARSLRPDGQGSIDR